MKGLLYFTLGITVCVLLDIIMNGFEPSYITFAIGLIATSAYGLFVFKNGFSVTKLIIGSSLIILTLLMMTFVFKMDIPIYTGLILAIFLLEGRDRKKADAKKAVDYN